jgi:hypothetical protein
MYHSKRNRIICACVGLLLATVVWASARKNNLKSTSQSTEVRVSNNTSALRVVSSGQVDHGRGSAFEVTVLNQSEKIVLAYTLSFGENTLTSFGLSLAPGDSNTERIPLANLNSLPADSSVRNIRLSAVYLLDGSTEGEDTDVGRLKNRMLGMNEQAASALATLLRASLSSDFDPDRLAQMVEEDISSTLLTQENADIPSERLAGRAFIKEKVLREMKELRKDKNASASDLQERVKNLRFSIEKISGVRPVRGEVER